MGVTETVARAKVRATVRTTTKTGAAKPSAGKTGAAKTGAAKPSAGKTDPARPSGPRKSKGPAKRALPPRGKMAPPVETLAKLREIHPDAHCELDHDGPFQLLVATVLSAQTTDVNVNKATPKLFARFPTPQALAEADELEVQPYVSTLGFFRQKAKSIVGLSKSLMENHGGVVPRTMEELTKLRGVGRKTANVVLGVIWNTPDGVVVDTHVQRLSQRLGWTRNTDPIDIEQDLVRLIPRPDWDMTSHLLIFHGRRVCDAQKPACESCGLNTLCPSAFVAEQIGRKPKRVRPA